MLAVMIAVAVVVAGELSGSHPLTLGPPRNAAEAIAMGDLASAARLVESGASANDIGVIRPGILGSRAVLATPLEAAVIRDQADMVEFLIVHGATRSKDIRCLAADVGATAVQARLNDHVTCGPGDALSAVLARP
jgi:hypothetical protein